MADVPRPRTVPFGLAQQATGPGVYLQQAGGQLGFYTSVLFMNSTVAFDASGNAIVTPVALSAIADKAILSNISGASALPVGNTLSAILDDILGSAQGQIITRNAANWTVISPGAVGTYLQSAGAGANLAYAIAQIASAPAFSATPTFDTATADVFTPGAMTASITALNFTGTRPKVIVALLQDGTGGRTVTAGASIDFGTDVPDLTGVATAANAYTYLGFVYHPTTTKYRLVAISK